MFDFIGFFWGFVFGSFIFESFIINFIYLKNIALFNDIILTKKNRDKLKRYYEKTTNTKWRNRREEI